MFTRLEEEKKQQSQQEQQTHATTDSPKKPHKKKSKKPPQNPIPSDHPQTIAISKDPQHPLNDPNQLSAAPPSFIAIDHQEYSHSASALPLPEEQKHMKAYIIPEVVVPKETLEWFAMDSIDPREEEAVPEFFSGKYPSKNAEVYKEYRNFLI